MLIAGSCRAYVCRDLVDMRNGVDGLSYLVEPLLAQQPMLCDELRYVAADREHATQRLIPWISCLEPATHNIYRFSSRLKTASFG
jgi:hypothetical protein